MAGIGTGVIVLLAVAASTWLIAIRAIPWTRRRLFACDPDRVPRFGGRLAMLNALRTIAATATITVISVLAMYGLAQAWLLWAGASPDRVEAVVGLRNILDGWIGLLGSGSASVWLGALILLAVIWLAVGNGEAQQRWTEAVAARRRALEASLQGITLAALREQLGGAIPGEIETKERILGVSQRNLSEVARVRRIPVGRFGDDGDLLSLDDIDQLRREALEHAEAVVEIEDQERARQFAARMSQTIAEFEQQIEMEIETFEGGRRSVLLSKADRQIAKMTGAANDALETAIRELAIAAVVARRLADHGTASASEERPEPELIREWVGAIASSELAVKSTSNAGRLGGHLAVVALVVSLLGFAASPIAATLAERSWDLQLSLLADRDSAGIAEALEAAPVAKPEPESIDSESELADDATTVQYARHAFRQELVRGLFDALPQTGQRDARRAAFRLASVEARQSVLLASERAAAPRLDGGAMAQEFRTHPASPPNAEQIDRILDERVKQLRQRDDLWAAMRREAARPATRREVADAMFKAAFAGKENDRVIQVMVRERSAAFAEVVARNGGFAGAQPPGAGDAELSLTARERRIVADFHAGVPEGLETRVAAYESGRLDPGSINRVALDPNLPRGTAASAGSPARGAPRVPSHPVGPPIGQYNRLFPAVAEASESSIVRGASAALQGVDLARSFGRIRFSGRIGGVVIGRDADSVAPDIDVTDMRWVVGSDGQVAIELVQAGGATLVGRFHPAIVHQALAYAADGRVVTTTLPLPSSDREQGSGGLEVPTRRVIVHPAMEDTSLGCRAIQIDRFVDSFTNTEAEGDEKLDRIAVIRSGVTLLGSVLDLVARRSIYERTDFWEELVQEEGTEVFAPIMAAAQICGSGADCFPIEHYTSLDMGGSAVSDFLNCAKSGGELDLCVPKLGAVSPANGYTVDSGVREERYDVDRELHFLTGADAKSTPLWPLDFIVQAVPTFHERSSFSVLADTGQSEIKEEPWIFPAFANDLRGVVAKGVATDSSAARVMAEMRQFTILQRLFRNALVGNLGLDFPLDKLSELAQQTHAAVKVARHERWNLNGELFELLARERDSLVEHLESALDADNLSDSCAARIKTGLSAEKAEPWPQSTAVWELVATLLDDCMDHQDELRSVLIEVNQLRSEELIDEAISIPSRIGRREANFACPAL